MSKILPASASVLNPLMPGQPKSAPAMEIPFPFSPAAKSPVFGRFPQNPRDLSRPQITAAMQLQVSAAVQDGCGTAGLERTWVTASLLADEDGE